jgi:hypothetical protein
VNEPRRRTPLDLLAGSGAGLLFGSLFLTWSHQLTRTERARFGGATLFGVPANPTAFQVYASTGIVLALLAAGIAATGLLVPHHGGWRARRLRMLALAAAVVGLGFVIRAATSAPTNGLLLAHGSGAQARYVTDPAAAGMGETVALIGLICAVTGLLPTVVPGRRISPS